MSLLSISQGAAAALNLPVPTSIVGNSEVAHAVALLQLAKQEGRQLMRRHDWQEMKVAAEVAALGTEVQTALPSDFDHFVNYSSIINATSQMPLRGPVSETEWQSVNYLSGSANPNVWALSGGLLYINPAPTAGDTLAFTYISKNYCESSGGTGQADWAADADVGRVPEHLVELGLIWRWLRSKGMDYAEEMVTYERELERAAARDRGSMPAMVISTPSGDSRTWYGTITQV